MVDKGYVVISWTGNDTERNIGNGFAEKWAEYENAWRLLDSQSGETLSAPLTGSKSACAVKLEAEEDWDRRADDPAHMRMIKGDFVVTGPDVEPIRFHRGR